MKDYGPFSPQRSDVSTPSSLYMESCEFSNFLLALLRNVLLKFNFAATDALSK